ncbi:hypothetical protein GCM10010172_67660 [Paractinoplanes ferrugineus]|uniref:HEAT repeat domain-containing protein n=1 Tax=Paractinoplanes ferrugineus TaxID=113564 RepID=A0A919J350_9ACTN|nr:hypothetical protein [Actinoplanes ferrugineus]GIE13073.1 hypothetical protein Afe05nite_49130 [Actinoplanes ferrugineus]
MTDDENWSYAGSRTVLGAVQRGLGRAVFRVASKPGGTELVLRCVVQDYRWDRQVDERAVYLARLVRQTKVLVTVLLSLLDEHPVDNGENTFDNALSTRSVLGRGDVPEAIDGLRAYVGAGPRWVEVLEQVAGDWPRELWDDLLPVAQARLADSADDVVGNGAPWKDWATVDDRIAAVINSRRGPSCPRPLRSAPTDDLLAAVATDNVGRQDTALRELNRRGPQPGLLPMLDALAVDDLYFPVGRAVTLLGAQALPVARLWASVPGHPMRWSGYRALAAHGDDSDVPALLAGWDWLDSRPDDLCGYDELATGLAHIGGDSVRAVVPRLRRLWGSPHTYERAAYLRALLVLDLERVHLPLAEGLWDCEADVRQLAAEMAPLEPEVEARLAVLRDDKMETTQVRAAARARLG